MNVTKELLDTLTLDLKNKVSYLFRLEALTKSYQERKMFCSLHGPKHIVKHLSYGNPICQDLAARIIFRCLNEYDDIATLGTPSLFQSISTRLQDTKLSCSTLLVYCSLIVRLVQGHPLVQNIARESSCLLSLSSALHFFLNNNSSRPIAYEYLSSRSLQYVVLAISKCVAHPVNKNNQSYLTKCIPATCSYIKNNINNWNKKPLTKYLVSLLRDILQDNAENQKECIRCCGHHIIISWLLSEHSENVHLNDMYRRITGVLSAVREREEIHEKLSAGKVLYKIIKLLVINNIYVVKNVLMIIDSYIKSSYIHVQIFDICGGFQAVLRVSEKYFMNYEVRQMVVSITKNKQTNPKLQQLLNLEKQMGVNINTVIDETLASEVSNDIALQFGTHHCSPGRIQNLQQTEDIKKSSTELNVEPGIHTSISTNCSTFNYCAEKIDNNLKELMSVVIQLLDLPSSDSTELNLVKTLTNHSTENKENIPNDLSIGWESHNPKVKSQAKQTKLSPLTFKSSPSIIYTKQVTTRKYIVSKERVLRKKIKQGVLNATIHSLLDKENKNEGSPLSKLIQTPIAALKKCWTHLTKRNQTPNTPLSLRSIVQQAHLEQ